MPLLRYALALLVPLDALGAFVVALVASVPGRLPECTTLGSPTIFRLMVFGLAFAIFYVTTLAIVLGVEGKGFSQIGTRGLKSERIVEGRRKKKRRLK